jgi:hypothetical protein
MARYYATNGVNTVVFIGNYKFKASMINIPPVCADLKG